jgi:monofunctional glycosyltransferase
MNARPQRKRGVVRTLFLLVLILVAAPLVLTIFYKVVPPVSTLMIFTRLVDGPIEREWVPFDEISKSLVASVVMSEDGRYCSHHGVDWREFDLVLANFDDRPRGASTIAMQTVKNLYLWNSRSYVRKAIEIPLALYANAVLGKRRLMEIYLNIAEFGPGVFGAEAAAQHYFGRSAKDLGPSQSALLTATLPSPSTRNPANPDRALRQRARAIAAEARIAGAYIVCLYP